jgi:hypothetical protein
MSEQFFYAHYPDGTVTMHSFNTSMMSPKIEQYYYKHEQSGTTHKRCFQPRIVEGVLTAQEVQNYFDMWNSSVKGTAIYSMNPVSPWVKE